MSCDEEHLVKAIRYDRYGPPSVLRLDETGVPEIGGEDVLVRVRAASVNPYDTHFMRGTPYLLRCAAGVLRPRHHGLGADLAGRVEEVGESVTRFAPGDEVFGVMSPLGTLGALAEYVSLHQDSVLAAKPTGLTFEQAAAVPLAAFTALQAVRDKGCARPGQRVLVNGAAGGVGTFAVQIAKALGAEVTGVCSTGKTELVGSIGADHVVDYTKQDFTSAGQRYDVLVDTVGNRTLRDCRRVLAPQGVLVGIGGPDKGRWLQPLIRPATMMVLTPVVSQTMTFFVARPNRDDLAFLRDLLETEKVTPVIDRTYKLSEVPQAIGYLEAGHATGKIIISM
jgi:NADPH:quinone reductase-like Zn-dependent oxidoreductase